MPGKTAKYYKNHPEALAKKKAYDTKYHATPERIRYRSKLNSINRKLGTYGNGDGLDVSHTDSKDVYILEKQTSNRKRQGAGKKPTKLKVAEISNKNKIINLKRKTK